MAEDASDESEAAPEVTFLALQLPAWRSALDAWMGRSGAHARTWNRFTRQRRRSDDAPVIVDQELIESFAEVREILLQDELDECMFGIGAISWHRWSHPCMHRARPHSRATSVRPPRRQQRVPRTIGVLVM